MRGETTTCLISPLNLHERQLCSLWGQNLQKAIVALYDDDIFKFIPEGIDVGHLPRYPMNIDIKIAQARSGSTA